jgi:hypothetical protein
MDHVKTENDIFFTYIKFSRQYLIAIAVLNIIWETLHMPLYEIWYQGTWPVIIYSGVHCTIGDIFIALTSLVIATIIIRYSTFSKKSFLSLVVLTTIFAFSYTIYSEWLNIYLRGGWAYNDLMPVLPIPYFNLGLSPLMQWIVIPPLAFWWANKKTALFDN